MMQDFRRQAWAEIDFRNLEHNFRHIKSLVIPQTKILVPVKSDAYGHGIIPISKKLIELGVDFLGVANVDEALRLRKEGINKPILILGLVFDKDLAILVNNKITPTICTKEQAIILDKESQRQSTVSPLHIKIDTGMGRLGINYKHAFDFIQEVARLKSIKLEGLFTHFPKADNDKEYTNYQISLFNDLLLNLKQANINIPLVHAANSMGVLDYSNSHFNLIRPGIIIYGLSPKDNFKLKLKPLMSVKTRILFVKEIAKGQGISYGHTYIAKSKRFIATLPIGYGDGYPRSLSNKADVVIGDRRFKVAGRVCMDQTLVDLKNDSKASIGDEVIMVGQSQNNRITIEELANISSTIPYEIACNFSKIPHIFID